MFRNYLMTAYKVLMRRKFFSFVNLFGIAITLAVITVVIAMLDNYIRPLGAEANSSNYVAIRQLELTNEDRSSSWSYNTGYRFLEQHVLDLETPDLIGFFHEPEEGTIFMDGEKVSPQVVMTDANFWSIMSYDFLAGRPPAADDIDAARNVAVLNAAMAQQLFHEAAPLGERFVLNGRPFEVIGVVANQPEMRLHAYGEIWVPYTTAPTQAWRTQWIDGFTALLWVEDADRLAAVRREFRDSLADFQHDDPERFQVARATADSKFETLARDFMNTRYEEDSKAGMFLLVLFAAMIAFMFLPTINLINLNVSRILERSGEIGVRKAFGASARTLIGQFLVENLVLSLIGGVLGFGLGLLLLDLLESSGLMAYADLKIDLRVFAGAFLMMVVFGLISGLYPAWKMARMHAVLALKRG